ncbi:hypothetical protein [Ramlibacter sp.]|uniref:hypothetical protein n=1 Tax=Ramlibacter sp. TaxID=1917967 RepID=UPI003D0A584A
MSDQARTQELLLLGQIHGLVQSLKDGQDLQNRRMDAFEKKVDDRFDGMDSRLRTVEQKAAVMGAVSGGAMAVGTALIIEGIKQWLGRGGPTP